MTKTEFENEIKKVIDKKIIVIKYNDKLCYIDYNLEDNLYIKDIDDYSKYSSLIDKRYFVFDKYTLNDILKTRKLPRLYSENKYGIPEYLNKLKNININDNVYSISIDKDKVTIFDKDKNEFKDEFSIIIDKHVLIKSKNLDAIRNYVYDTGVSSVSALRESDIYYIFDHTTNNTTKKYGSDDLMNNRKIWYANVHNRSTNIIFTRVYVTTGENIARDSNFDLKLFVCNKLTPVNYNEYIDLDALKECIPGIKSIKIKYGGRYIQIKLYDKNVIFDDISNLQYLYYSDPKHENIFITKILFKFLRENNIIPDSVYLKFLLDGEDFSYTISKNTTKGNK